ncbi:MAG TPA: tetratricopeptide repeat protein [Dongiaceae bacterium]|nr:tetratricopeptide repeat protein [Dongiaceae bacterium]
MIRMSWMGAMGALALGLAADGQASFAQGSDAKLGKVHFDTSCNAAAQADFDRAMLYQHSFWYRASQKAFESALAKDPACAIAYWGIALSLLNNPHAAPPPANLPAGLAAIEKARAAGAKTQREKDFIEALSAIYVDFDKIDHATRVRRYAKAMEQLAERYPNDDEAQLYYGLALNVAASPADKTYADQLKGAAILEKIAARQPQHPGVWHYMIHLYDYPPIAQQGINAARQYAKVAPDAPHALHMPSHIFTRVGYWSESIASNKASAQVAKEDKEAGDQLHANDYLVYAYLQLGQDRKAREVITEMMTVANVNPNVRAGTYALAASPARYMVERGDWQGAATLEVRSAPGFYVDAITHFARALGAARSGKPEAAEPDLAKLVELRDKLLAAKDAYWAEQVDVQWRVASAWQLQATGKKDEALAAMSAAADQEDKTEKSPVTPGPLAPARELYGQMLMQAGKPADALAQFEKTLAKEPNRLGAYVGAARAAKAAGDVDKARSYYAKIVALTTEADTERTEIAEARGASK